MDYNWFFSSVAQSSAAIIGVFMAFVISKILSNQNRFSLKENKIRNLKNKIEFYKDSANDIYFAWYCERRRKNAIEKMVEEEGLLKTIHPIPSHSNNIEGDYWHDEEITEEILFKKYNEYQFSVYDNRSDVYQEISDYLTGREEYKKVFLIDIHSKVNNKEIIEEEEKINKLKNEVNNLIREVNDFIEINKSNPENSELIRLILLFIGLAFYIGVIYPLSFLPVQSGEILISLSLGNILESFLSFQGILLTIISVIFYSIMIVFYSSNEKLKFKEKDITYLSKYNKIENYSGYFRNMAENLSYIKENRNAYFTFLIIVVNYEMLTK